MRTGGFFILCVLSLSGRAAWAHADRPRAAGAGHTRGRSVDVRSRGGPAPTGSTRTGYDTRKGAERERGAGRAPIDAYTPVHDRSRRPGHARGRAPVRAFVIEGPRIGGVREVEAPVAAAGQVVVDVARVGVCGTDVELFTGEMAYLQTGRCGVPAADRARVVRHRALGGAGRRRGVARAAGHGRHDARLRPLPALPERPAAPVRGPVRGRDPARVARRPGRAARGPRELAARAAGRGGRRQRRAGRARRQRVAGGRGGRRRRGRAAAGAGRRRDRAAGGADGARPRREVHLLARREGTVRFTRSLGFEHVWRPDALPAGTFDGVVDASNAVELPALAVDLVEPGRRVVWIGLAGSPAPSTAGASCSGTSRSSAC